MGWGREVSPSSAPRHLGSGGVHDDRVSGGPSPWPGWLIAVTGTWLVVIVVPMAWAGATPTGHPSHKWTAAVVASLATLAVGWILATRHAWTKARVLALGGGLAW